MEGLMSIRDMLGQALGLQMAGATSESTSEVAVDNYMKRKAERYNASAGNLNIDDGYNCEKCKNRGNTMELTQRNGMWYETIRECECMKVRRSIARMRASGLEKSISKQRLSTFQADADWQKAMLDTAQAYIKDGVDRGAWFFIGGQSGAGKTHICTGIARELLYAGHEIRYVIWEQVKKELKAVINEPEYADEIGKLERAEILYLDDLFKPIKGQAPTDADLRIAFELLNYRYVNMMPTIISSELYLDDIFELDQAIEGRINERSKGYAVMIERDNSRNYRRRN